MHRALLLKHALNRGWSFISEPTLPPCEDGNVWRPCKPDCPYCHLLAGDCTETEECIPGCTPDCDEGHMFDGEKCVPPSDCKCRFDNDILLVSKIECKY